MLRLSPVVGLTACALIAALTPAVALDRVTVGETGHGSAIHWPAYIAAEKGFFAEKGLEVEFVPAPSSAGVMQQLAAGSLDLAVSGPGDALRAIDKGAPIAVLRVEAQAAPYEVFGRKGMAGVADLQGKIVMVGGAKDITRYYLDRMLEAKGLKPGGYDMVFAGATSQRFAALQSGSIDATILNAPFNFKASAAGFASLGVTARTVNDIPFGTISVNRAWGLAHRDLVSGFNEAFARGVDFFYDPSHRAETLAIFEKISKTNPEEAAQTYDFYASLKMFDRTGSLAKSGLDRLAADMKRDGDLDGSTDLAHFTDPAFAR